MKLQDLPYTCKELINLYALNTFKDYEALKELNEIMDYEPCIYSNIKLIHAEKNYNGRMKVNKDLNEKKMKLRLIKFENVCRVVLRERKNTMEQFIWNFRNFAVKIKKKFEEFERGHSKSRTDDYELCKKF